MTNNDSESYDGRMRKKLGDHPNLPTVLGALRFENTLVERDCMQNDRPNAERQRRSENRNRFGKRAEWEERLVSKLDRGITDDEIVKLKDEMFDINRELKRRNLLKNFRLAAADAEGEEVNTEALFVPKLP